MSYVAADLGTLPGGGISVANATNSDGSLIVGYAKNSGGARLPVYWDAGGAIHALPTLNNGGQGSVDEAIGCSADGTVIVGVSDPGVSGNIRAVVWKNGPAWTISTLAVFPPCTVGFNSGASCCSSDGSLIFGYCYNGGGGASITPCQWTNGVISALPGTLGQPYGAVNGCSTNGVYAVGGIRDNNSNGNAAIWTNGVLTALTSPGSNVNFLGPQANGVSSTGGVVVGFGWDPATFATLGGDWAPSSFNQFASPLGGPDTTLIGCDGTGVFIVGTGDDNISFLSSAFVWVSGSPTQLPLIAGAATRQGQASAVSQDATTIVGYGINASHRQTAIRWTWSGPPIPGAGGPPTAPAPPSTLRLPVRFLLCQPTDWTLTQPVRTVYGLDHLAGMYVIGLADGVLIGPLLVSSDGAVTLPFPASAIILGMSFTPQVQTTDLDAGTPTIQGRRKDILAVTARVKSSLGVQVGSNQPDGAALDPPQNAPTWSGMQTIQTPAQSPSYISPSGQLVTLPITGDLYASIPGEWDVPGQVAVAGTPGQPLYVLAVIPEILEGDTVEQTYAKAPEQGRRPQQKRGERPVPGMWMIGGDA